MELTIIRGTKNKGQIETMYKVKNYKVLNFGKKIFIRVMQKWERNPIYHQLFNGDAVLLKKKKEFKLITALKY